MTRGACIKREGFIRKKINVCENCGKEDVATTMSMFDTKMICMDCDENERKDPRYKEAVDADVKAIKSGDYNFPGIGRR